MARPKNIGNFFNPDPRGKTKLGAVGYDNARENIDPHIKTQVVSSKEGTVEHTPTLAKHITNKEYVDANDFSFLAGNGIQLDIAVPPNTVTVSVVEAEVDHDILKNFVTNKHIDWTDASQNLFTGGNISLGTLQNTSSKVFIVFTPVNLSNRHGVNVNFNPTTTVDGTYNNTCFNATVSVVVDATKTNSGQLRGGRYQMLGATGFDGRAVNFKSLECVYGIHSTAGSSSAVTNCYGLALFPFAQKGTIDNLYNIYLAAPASGGTVTNGWAIYSLDTNPSRLNGDLYFNTEDSGLLFAEIYARDNTTLTSTSTTKTQITIFDTDGESNGMTPSHANDHITVVKAGKYKIDSSISIKNSSGAAHVISVEMYKNNGTGVFNNIHAGRTLGVAADVGNMTMSGIVDVAANDTLEFWITSDSGTARTVTVEDINFCAIQIGGT